MTNDEIFSKLGNEIINDPTAQGRIEFATILSNGIGQILMLPPPILEQLIARLEADYKELSIPLLPDTPLRDVMEALTPLAKATSLRVTATLKAFLEIRPTLIESLKKHGLKSNIPE